MVENALEMASFGDSLLAPRLRREMQTNRIYGLTGCSSWRKTAIIGGYFVSQRT